MLKNFFGIISLAIAFSILVVCFTAYSSTEEPTGSNNNSGNSTETPKEGGDKWNHIQSFMDISESIKVDEDCHIGVGYTQNLDWNINAKDFFKIYEDSGITDDLVPTEHAEIDSHKKFLETFLYFFQNGISSERATTNPVVVKDIIRSLIDQKIEHSTEDGGHASKFAERIEQEGCKVLFLNKTTEVFLEDTWGEATTEQVCDEPLETETDDHICILYQEGEEYFGYTAPRANRFYFIYDPKGSKFEIVEKYHETVSEIEEDSKLRRHMFAGYQYSEGAPKEDAKSRFKVMKKEWSKMKEENSDHTIHVELAHFNLDHTLHFVVKHLFNLTDSLGLNEHEIYTLLNQYVYYQNLENPEKEKLPAYDAHNSLLTPMDSLNLINDLITKFMSDGKNSITRVQYHTLGHMVTCYDPEKWESGINSLFRSGYTSATYWNMMTIEDEPDIWKSHVFTKLDLHGLPKGMEFLPHENTIPENLLKEGVEMSDFLQYIKIEDSKYICGVISTAVCKSPSKLSGLGDNISSTGFTYQKRKFE